MKQTRGKKVEVAIRMRPLIYEYQDCEAWMINQESKKVSSIPKNPALRNNTNILNEDSSQMFQKRKAKQIQLNNVYEFSCDYVFKDTCSNKLVYDECCSKAVEDFLLGNNSTIFMYGQTTSGKTYTMLGDQKNQGLIIYSLKDIFDKLKNKRAISISYLEIYNEQINDLLNEGSTNLKIIDDSVQGLVQCKVQSIDEALQLLNEGQYQRAYSEKKYHDHSSRSHTIFQIKIMENETKVKALLNLVDLSGSERLTDEESSEETAYINKSLFVLSNVIHKLANPKKNLHIPFRDSKLTRLLAPSLTNSKNTIIICTISPAQVNFSQTLSTLRFATQSRKIQLKSMDQSFNESIEIDKRRISQLMEQNTILKKNLSFAQQTQTEFKFVETKIKYLEELLAKKQLPLISQNKLSLWRQKAGTLCSQYEKNVEILQKQYLKAVVNLTSNQLKLQKECIREILEKND